MFSARLQRTADILKGLKRCKAAKLKKALTNDVLKSLSECCYNVLHGNVPANGQQLKTLTKYKKQLRNMADRRVSLKKKRQLVTQSGGFLGPLLGVIAPILSSLLFRK